VELGPILVFDVGKANVDARGYVVVDATAGGNNKVVVGAEAARVVEDTETDQAFAIDLEPSQIEAGSRACEIGFGMDVYRLIELKEARLGFDAIVTPDVDVSEWRGAEQSSLTVLEVILRSGSAGVDGDALLISGGNHLS
jgi:hypothetical protein